MGAVRHELLEPVLFYGMLAAFTILIMVILAKGLDLVPGRGTTLATEPDTRIMLAILGTAAIGPGIILIGGHILSSQAIGMLGLFHQGVAILLVAALLRAWMMEKIPRTFPVILACAGIFFMTLTGGILMFSNSTNLRQIIFSCYCSVTLSAGRKLLPEQEKDFPRLAAHPKKTAQNAKKTTIILCGKGVKFAYSSKSEEKT